jgi:hypothetical protein
VPGRLLLRTGGACDLDPAHLLEVWAAQRHRFAAVLRGFGPSDWAAPTRCADWCAHDVVRHLCDGTAIAAGADDHALDLAAGYDPRITPRGWPAVSANESPGATLAGRPPATAVLGDLPASSRATLLSMANFFNTPA